jgi:prepilin-type N-terminal cleavage/methylation domain-containing protein
MMQKIEYIKDMKSSGFTMIEIIIVTVLIGIMAAFALTGYNKTIAKGEENNANIQLTAIHAANTLYREKNGTYYDQGTTSATTLNGALGIALNLGSRKTVSYAYDSANDEYTATISYSGTPNFSLRVNEGAIDNTNPCCSAGDCPGTPNC